MLPVARGGMKLAGGAGKFFKGRAHRILPPYYIALLASIVVIVLLRPAGERLAFLHEPGNEVSIVFHFLLIQNLSLRTFYGINGPLWSIATECQIYLLFPFIVLAWRRAGTAICLLGIFILAHAAFHFCGEQIPFNYVFTFALGAAAAVESVERRSERWLPLVCCAGLIGYFFSMGSVIVSDLCVGIFVAALMAMLSAGRLAWLRVMLSTRLLVWVGSFSYSLYLIHALLQDWYLSTSFSARHTGTALQLITMFLIVSPLNYGVAYLFYRVAEKPFLNRKRRPVDVSVFNPVLGQQDAPVSL